MSSLINKTIEINFVSLFILYWVPLEPSSNTARYTGIDGLRDIHITHVTDSTAHSMAIGKQTLIPMQETYDIRVLNE